MTDRQRRENLVSVEVFEGGDDAGEAGVGVVVDVEAAVAAAHAVVEPDPDHLRHQSPAANTVQGLLKIVS